MPNIVFLLSITNGKEAEALKTIGSINEMRCGNWQVVPVTLEGELQRVLQGSISDERLRSPIHSGKIKKEIALLTGVDFLIFCDAGDIFDVSLPAHFHAALSRNAAADIYYFDSEQQRGSQTPSLPFFKPTADSPELLFSINYLARGFIRYISVAQMLPSLREVDDPLVLEYELMIRLLESRASTCHIPRLLLTQTCAEEKTEAGIDEVIREHLSGKGLDGITIERGEAGRRVTWRLIEPSVSIIILNRNHGNWLRTLVNSIFTLTDYSNYSVIIVDNNSTEENVKAFYSELEKNDRVQVVHYDRDFNYSEAINTGVARSQAEVIVLLNNDMQITTPRWLGELVRWAIQPEVGVIGGKLLHRNRSIQHAGIILGMNGFIGHLYLNAPEHYHGLAGSVDWYRNYHALTGACQAMRRQLFNQVGGYDERFRLAFGDIDFCLRVFKAGYRNLYNPYAELIHYEGGSRGYETPVKDILLGYDELGNWLREDDAYFSPNLTYTPIPKCDFTPNAVNVRLANIENRKRALQSGRLGA